MDGLDPSTALDLGVTTGSRRVADAAAEARERTLGGVYAFSAYLLWGFLPLYFLLLAPTGPWEIVAWRIVLSFVFCLLLLTVTRTWPKLMAIVRQPRLLGWTALAGVLIYVDATAKELAVPKEKIKRQLPSQASLMPDNFSSVIPAREFNDLVAYLLSHRQQ